MSTRMAGIGPVTIDVVPMSHLIKKPKDINLSEVWKICGPAAERNLNGAPIWKVIAMAYLEGLHHGSALAHSKQEALKDE